MQTKNDSTTSTVQTAILNIADKFCSNIALQAKTTTDWTKTSYQELSAQVEINKNILNQIGIKNGDRIILLTETCPAAIWTYLAILAAGATPVLPDPNLPPNDLADLIDFMDAKAILVTDRYLTNIIPERTTKLAVRNLQQQLAPCVGFRETVDSSLPLTTDGDNEVAVILFTSGTTGTFKAVQLTHKNLLTVFQHTTTDANITSNDPIVVFLPFYHISGLLACLALLYVGATVTTIAKPDGETITEAMQFAKPTYLHAVPLVLEHFLKSIKSKLSTLPSHKKIIVNTLLFVNKKFIKFTGLNLGKYFFPPVQKAFGNNLKTIINLGAALKESILSDLEGFGFNITDVYGLSETTGALCSNYSIKNKKAGIVGLPLCSMEIKIKTNGEETGEIMARGPALMKGYFREPNLTKDSWFATGDLGMIDQHGYLHIVGRSKELIVFSSGKKIMPSAVETHYQNIPQISELAVIGMPAANGLGEEIHAAIIPNSPTEFSKCEKEIFKQSAKLPNYLQIKRVYEVTVIPKTSALKIKRAQLKQYLLNNLQSKPENIKAPNSAPIPMPIINQKSAAPEIIQWLCCWLANKLSIDLTQVDRHKNIFHYELDSLSAAELHAELATHLNTNLPQDLFFISDSINDLGEKIAAVIKIDQSNNSEKTTKNNNLASSQLTIEQQENKSYPLWPMNFTELGFWLRSEKKLAHTLSVSLLIQTDLGEKSLADKIAQLVNYSSDMQFFSNKSSPVIIHDQSEKKWQSQFNDLTRYSPEQQQDKLNTYFKKTNQQGDWKYEGQALIRIIIFKLAKNQFEIHCHFSHLLFDYRSVLNFMQQLSVILKDQNIESQQTLPAQLNNQPSTNNDRLFFCQFNTFTAYKAFIKNCVEEQFSGLLVKKSWLTKPRDIEVNIAYPAKKIAAICGEIACLKNELAFALFLLGSSLTFDNKHISAQFYRENRSDNDSDFLCLASGQRIKINSANNNREILLNIIEQIRLHNKRKNEFTVAARLDYVHIPKKYFNSKLFRSIAKIIGNNLFRGVTKNLYSQKIVNIFSISLLSDYLSEISNLFSRKQKVILTYIDNSTLDQNIINPNENIKPGPRQINVYQMVKTKSYKNVVANVANENIKFKFYAWPGYKNQLEINFKNKINKLLDELAVE